MLGDLLSFFCKCHSDKGLVNKQKTGLFYFSIKDTSTTIA